MLISAIMKDHARLFALVPILILIGCTHRSKVSLSGEEAVDIKEFFKIFEVAELPYQFADSSVVRTPEDSTLISYKLLTQFIADTTYGRLFGKSERPRIYPVCRIAGPEDGTYLILKSLSTTRKAITLLCFDKKNKFIAGMPVLIPDANPATQQFLSIDKKYTISKNISRRNADGTIKEGKDVYVLNEPTRSFLLIMTDALDEQKVEVINPIESLPRKSRYSGDYVKDKWNLVSIRDSRKQGHMNFFVHFEKKNNCSGEVRGEASYTSANSAVYRGSGDFCVLQFRFTVSSVTISEMEGCGSHRGIDCVFEGTFPKKKEARKKETGKPKKNTAK